MNILSIRKVYWLRRPTFIYQKGIKYGSIILTMQARVNNKTNCFQSINV